MSIAKLKLWSDSRFIGALSVVLVFLLGFFFLYQEDCLTSRDMSSYLTQATNLALGNGPLTIFGFEYHFRIGYLYLLAAVLKLSSFNLAAVVAMQTAFCAFFLVFLFLVAKRLGGLVCAWLTVFLFMGATPLISIMPRQLDVVWPACLMAALYCLLCKAGKSSLPLAFSAGILVGAAVGIKLTAVLFLVIPLGMAVIGLRITVKELVVFYIGASLLIFPAMAGIQDEIAATIRPGGDFSSGFFEIIIKGLIMYVAYTTWHFPIMPFLFASFFLSCIYAMYKKEKILLCICLAILVFTPNYMLIGFYKMRLGQSVFGIGLCYILIAYLINRAAILFSARSTKRYSRTACIVLLLIGFTICQVSLARGAVSLHRTFARTLAYQVVNEHTFFSYTSPVGVELADWVKKHQDARVLYYPHLLARGVFFGSLTTANMFPIRAVHFDNDTIISQRNTGSGRAGLGLKYLQQVVEQNNIEYVAALDTYGDRPLTDFLKKAPGVELAYTAKNTEQQSSYIFRITDRTVFLRQETQTGIHE